MSKDGSVAFSASFMFSGLMIDYLLVHQATDLLWFPFFPEIDWGDRVIGRLYEADSR